MWCGDFIGSAVEVNFAEATFRVDRPLGDKRRAETPNAGALIRLSYSKLMELREATDAERQISIVEQAGEIEIK
jgi:hypothetical protein